MEDRNSILRPGENCWRIERANRFAVIVDAQNYFRAVKESILAAEHSVYLIGWDFDTRVEFERGKTILPGPNSLGAFLRWLDKHRPSLQVYILKWDLGLLFELGRGTTPLAMLGWLTSDRIHIRLDSAHPAGAAQHQKIVVVDDVLAFCGGIDITTDRWDTRSHLDKDERRRRASGAAYGPWHDATTAVDGKVALALGELARTRWLQATGERLAAPQRGDAFWPSEVEPLLENVDVAIARTVPPHNGIDPVREIESLYLTAIANASKTIYCESQYFASRRIAEAMAKRLGERDGPEIVVVNPESADGYLESAVMDTARARLLKVVRKADVHDRFRIYRPVTAEHAAIYVHAKILIIDDWLLRVGSSNFNNRSLGFDVECDLAVDASGGVDTTRDRILAVRHDLLAEHLGTTTQAVSETLVANSNSLIRTIEALASDSKSLAPYSPDEPNTLEETLAESDLLDPEQPPPIRKRLYAFMSFDASPLR
jgi:phospholipase D1/2